MTSTWPTFAPDGVVASGVSRSTIVTWADFFVPKYTVADVLTEVLSRSSHMVALRMTNLGIDVEDGDITAALTHRRQRRQHHERHRKLALP